MQFSTPWRKDAGLHLRAALILFAALAFTLQASSQRFITFDAPNAGNTSGTGTQPTGINAFGVITGIVIDNSFAFHGFVHTPWGESTSFDAPGADPVTGCTCPMAINDRGVILGYTIDAKSAFHGFLRKPDGAFIIFDVPGAASSIFPDSINDFGVATGHYFDSVGVIHGFRRNWDGRITEFEDPAAGDGVSEGTWPDSINNFGVIAGFATDAQEKNHGFLRTRQGDFTNFDVPGAIGSLLVNAYVNDVGVIAGTYIAQPAVDHEVEAGFQRMPDGTITVYAAPTGPLENLWVNALNIEGTATGFFEGSSGYDQAFVRYASGQLIPISFPSDEVESVGAGINVRGGVSGWWIDSSSIYHGYIWLP